MRFLLITVAALLLVACAGGPGTMETPSPRPTAQAVMGEAVVVMEADNFYFEPRLLRSQPGQTVTLQIQDVSGTLHNFSIPEQQIDQDIPPRGQIEVEVTFPQSGSVDFVCKYHVAQGMRGQLLVGEAVPGGDTPEAAPTPAPGLGY
jgi:plastocyanin